MFILHILVISESEADLHNRIILCDMASFGPALTIAGWKDLWSFSWFPARFMLLAPKYKSVGLSPWVEAVQCSPGLALPGPEAGTGTGADLRDPGAGVDLDPLHVRVSKCSSLLWRGLSPGHTGRGRHRSRVRFVQELDIWDVWVGQL